MLSTLSKVGALVVAGATVQAAVLTFDFASLATIRPDLVQPVAAGQENEATRTLVAEVLAERLALAEAEAPPTSEELIGFRPIPPLERDPVRTSAGTQRILNALDAFEDELLFHAALRAATGGGGDGYDPAGNILATILPPGWKGSDHLVGISPGFSGSVVAAAAGEAPATAPQSTGDETVTRLAALAGFGTIPITQRSAVDPEASPIPLPAGAPLLLGGLAAFVASRRRR